MKTFEKSSNIEAVGFDKGKLTIKFRNGGTYDYHGVTEDERKAFIEAESIGKHFHAEIRNKHKGTKRDAE